MVVWRGEEEGLLPSWDTAGRERVSTQAVFIYLPVQTWLGRNRHRIGGGEREVCTAITQSWSQLCSGGLLSQSCYREGFWRSCYCYQDEYIIVSWCVVCPAGLCSSLSWGQVSPPLLVKLLSSVLPFLDSKMAARWMIQSKDRFKMAAGMPSLSLAFR
jgi:hypothetical protein